eukprot:IDg22058t1
MRILRSSCIPGYTGQSVPANEPALQERREILRGKFEAQKRFFRKLLRRTPDEATDASVSGGLESATKAENMSDSESS